MRDMATTRSPNYPSLSLSEAVDHARLLYDKERQSPTEADQVVRAWGYKGLSGPSRTKLSALRKYGLLEETPTGFRLSNRAMAILFPRDAEEATAALLDAALTPDLFRELSTFEGASDDNLISRLVRMGFTPTGAKAAVASYRETMTVVGLETSGYNASHEAAVDVPAPQIIAPLGIPAPAMTTSNEAGIVFSIALPGGARADLRVAGPLTRAGMKLLRDYLDLVEKSVSQDETSIQSDYSPTNSGQSDGTT